MRRGRTAGRSMSGAGAMALFGAGGPTFRYTDGFVCLSPDQKDWLPCGARRPAYHSWAKDSQDWRHPIKMLQGTGAAGRPHSRFAGQLSQFPGQLRRRWAS